MDKAFKTGNIRTRIWRSGEVIRSPFFGSGLWGILACVSMKIWAQDVVSATYGRKNGH